MSTILLSFHTANSPLKQQCFCPIVSAVSECNVPLAFWASLPWRTLNTRCCCCCCCCCCLTSTRASALKPHRDRKHSRCRFQWPLRSFKHCWITQRKILVSVADEKWNLFESFSFFFFFFTLLSWVEVSGKMLHYASALNKSAVTNSWCHKTALNDNVSGILVNDLLWLILTWRVSVIFRCFFLGGTDWMYPRRVVYLTSDLQRAIVCALRYVSVLSIKLHFWWARPVFLHVIVINMTALWV